MILGLKQEVTFLKLKYVPFFSPQMSRSRRRTKKRFPLSSGIGFRFRSNQSRHTLKRNMGRCGLVRTEGSLKVRLTPMTRRNLSFYSLIKAKLKRWTQLLERTAEDQNQLGILIQMDIYCKILMTVTIGRRAVTFSHVWTLRKISLNALRMRNQRCVVSSLPKNQVLTHIRGFTLKRNHLIVPFAVKPSYKR